MWPFGKRDGLSMAEATGRAEHLVRRYASYAPYRLVADPVALRNLIRGLARNWVKHGLPLCPCKQVTGDRVQDRRLVCPCKDHHDEIKQYGSCCCGLFWKGD
jgi:ferredoxin-thioredoxin reductase catalytic chain